MLLGVLIYGRCIWHQRYGAAPRFSYAIAEGVTLFIFLAGSVRP